MAGNAATAAAPAAATASRLHRASNDAFGEGSPHWNLPFPAGRLTAAEIMAYCPHWLKSVDVIDRFVTNGAKAKLVAGMLSVFRILPSANGITANSVCVMMQCAMRAANFSSWTMGGHSGFVETRPDEWDPNNLDVSDFRKPYETHPKTGSKRGENVPAQPIEFRDLANDVKQHPLGDDALDLTRCVLYAIDHPDESWLFPTDFERLVNKLGGPEVFSHFHSDTEAFQRATLSLFTPTERRGLAVTPLSTEQHDHSDTTVAGSYTNTTNMRLPIPRASAATSKKRNRTEVDNATERSPNPKRTRRSTRVATQPRKNMCESDTDTSNPTTKRHLDSDESFSPPQKKRKTLRSTSVESDFVGYTSDSDSIIDMNGDTHIDLTEDLLSPQPTRRHPVRASAQQSRIKTRINILKEMPKSLRSRPSKSFTQTRIDSDPNLALPTLVPVTTDNRSDTPAETTTAGPKPPVPTHLIDPQLFSAASAWVSARPAPIRARTPVLPSSRLVVDGRSIQLYSEEGLTTIEAMWASALSSTRFGGPRKHAPFRELYRLTDPEEGDESDWAENIRWAKEQHRAFGTKTWTESQEHLEEVTGIRRETMWVSEEVGMGDVGMRRW